MYIFLVRDLSLDFAYLLLLKTLTLTSSRLCAGNKGFLHTAEDAHELYPGYPEKVEEKTPAEALIEKAESAGIETEVIKEEATPVEASVDDISLAEGLLDEALEVAETSIAPTVEEEAIDESEDTTEEESEEEVEEAPTTTENQNPKKKNKKNRHNK